MEEGTPSATALLPAILRAAHQVLDDEPRILEDPLAVGLFDRASEESIRAGRELYQRDWMRLVRAFFVMRNRYAEDVLAGAIQSGTSQYVVLGAGLDTFAYRNPYPDLSVYEVDHPDTQRWKRKRLAEVGIPIPETVRYVPIDFERQSLPDAMAAGEFRSDSPAVFAWLGVTPYLTRDAIFETLRYVRSLGPSNTIVFDFSVPDSLITEEEREIVAMITKVAASRGEPWLTSFAPSDLAAELRSMGFRDVHDFTPELARRLYFQDRRDGLPMLPSARMMRATV